MLINFILKHIGMHIIFIVLNQISIVMYTLKDFFFIYKPRFLKFKH